MRWIIDFLTSSIGKKLVMALSGLFLTTFLVVHLIGNVQLLYNDGGQAFNIYAKFMTSNPLISTISWGLYATILLHAVQGILIMLSNKKAKGSKYAVTSYENGNWMSKNMGLLGILIFAFICIHMGDFWWKMKWSSVYMIGLVALSLHLIHGFQSGFTTLGLVHKKYTPIIKLMGLSYSILVPLGFAMIPLYIFFKNLWNY